MNIREKIQKKLADAPSEGPVSIAFLGDSVTHGCFEVFEKERPGWIDCVYDQENVYVNRFRKKFEAMFPQCPLTVINAGISGGSAQLGAERLKRDVISFHPDICVVAFGLNDVLSENLDAYIGGLKSIFEQLKEADIVPVLMTQNMLCNRGGCSPVKFLEEMSYHCAELQNNGTFDRFIEEAKALCAREGIAVADCYADWKKLEAMGVDTTYLLSNYLNHPTREMHELFASRLIDTIIFK